MKQYTNESQTASLIELGFENPKMAAPALKWVDGEPTFKPQYTIGELIEMLGYDLYSMHYLGMSWEVKGEQVAVINEELIDALYDMVVKLKEKEVV